MVNKKKTTKTPSDSLLLNNLLIQYDTIFFNMHILPKRAIDQKYYKTNGTIRSYKTLADFSPVIARCAFMHMHLDVLKCFLQCLSLIDTTHTSVSALLLIFNFCVCLLFNYF